MERPSTNYWLTRDKNGTEYIIWDRVLSYLTEFGFSTSGERPEFIPENIFYRLAMKAKNEFAEEGTDYELFLLHEENPLGGRPSTTTDKKLSTAGMSRK